MAKFKVYSGLVVHTLEAETYVVNQGFLNFFLAGEVVASFKASGVDRVEKEGKVETTEPPPVMPRSIG